MMKTARSAVVLPLLGLLSLPLLAQGVYRIVGPDGRVLYWNPNSGRPFGNTSAGTGLLSPNGARTGRNTYFGDVFLLENTNKGKGQQLTVSLTKPASSESDWSWSLGYTRTNAEEVSALTSSTAGSGYGSQFAISFYGVAPAENPKFVVGVTIYKAVGVSNSLQATFPFKAIMQQALKSYRVPPSTTKSPDLPSGSKGEVEPRS